VPINRSQIAFALGLENGERSTARSKRSSDHLSELLQRPGRTRVPGYVHPWNSLVDRAVAVHVAKQGGFVSRESAAGEGGEWLVIIHRRSVENAEASMATFAKAPVAASFMSKIDAATMIKRYQR
jgi:hypothetical protein